MPVVDLIHASHRLLHTSHGRERGGVGVGRRKGCSCHSGISVVGGMVVPPPHPHSKSKVTLRRVRKCVTRMVKHKTCEVKFCFNDRPRYGYILPVRKVKVCRRGDESSLHPSLSLSPSHLPVFPPRRETAGKGKWC